MTSVGAVADGSREPVAGSSLATSPAAAVCAWCRQLLEETGRGRRFCRKQCRQAAFRLRKRTVVQVLGDAPLRFAYADPPYPGLSAKYYKGEPTFAGEVDHAALIETLKPFDGWALSTSAKALRDVLPLCPPTARVCSWVKPIGASPRTFGIHNCWEPVIVVPGRRRRGGQRDWLSAQPARFGGDLPGRKPLAFAAWLFGLLGMQPGDTLADLFPGTGIIGRAWEETSRAALDAAASSPAPAGASRPGADDPSPRYQRDAAGASSEYFRDPEPSPAAADDVSPGDDEDGEASSAARADALGATTTEAA